MTTAVLQFLAAAAVIVVAGTFLTRYADAIAEITGFGRLLIGSILLAGATSLPELTVDISAVRGGMADLAVGDLMGSSLFNLLILAIMDLSHRQRGRLFSRAASAHALSATVSMALAALAGISILVGHRLGGVAILHMSYGSLVIVVAYLLSVRMIFFDQQVSAQQANLPEHVPPTPGMTLRRAVIGFLIAAAAIVITGPYVAEAAGEIAEISGLGKTFVGTTLVAFSTSLPELVATLTAMRIGAFDLAAGNIFGSNAFNMVLLAPLDLVSAEPLMASVSVNHAVTCFAAILVTSVAVMGQLYQVERRRWLIEPDALAVVLLVVGALGLLYYLR
jgi:cation:H+ antiporter